MPSGRAESPPAKPASADIQMPAPVGEVLVAGRRYLLVPVDDGAQCPSHAAPAAEVLTARELQIVALVAEGHVNKQIADLLRISEWTVSTHLRRIFAKLNVDTRAAMVSHCCGRVLPPADHP